MDSIFGAPIEAIALVLAGLFALLAGFVAFVLVRNTILARMAVRNVVRRPARTALVITGLMLATAIIGSAFTTGDSITFSIKRDVVDALGEVDELVVIDRDSEVWEDIGVPETFPESVFREVESALTADSLIDGVMPSLSEVVPVVNIRSQQFDVSGQISGLDPQRVPPFGVLLDQQGLPMDLAGLGPNEVYLDAEGASELAAVPGDVLGLALGPGELHEVTVKGIVDGSYGRQSDVNVVVMLPLSKAQELLSADNQISTILISNRGDRFQGETVTAEVMDKFAELPAIVEAGLRIQPIKQDLIELANELGSLFVSFFTTFGLFSIGVGLLLIFLIFSMLAAERKNEMGMARAVGMQRRHLVRMFMFEGAVYGIGSSLVGAAVGIGLGLLLVNVSASIFSTTDEGFELTPHVGPYSVLVSFLIGGVITLITVWFASRRVSRLNIVRAIRDIPEPSVARAGRRTLVWGMLITVVGLLILFAGIQSSQLTAFGLGISIVPMGLGMVLRWRGVSQRRVLSGIGLWLVVYWLLPASVIESLKDDWSQDFSIFFLSGVGVVAGSVLLTVNNSPAVLVAVTQTVGRFRRFTPVIKSAVSYPLRFGFRTGLSIAMFAVVIFSVVVMASLNEAFAGLFDDQNRLGGGYEVMAFSSGDLNPIGNTAEAVEADSDLSFVSRVNGVPSVGTFRTIWQAQAGLGDANSEGKFEDGNKYRSTAIVGVDDDFVESNSFQVELAASQYAGPDGFDSSAVWRDIGENPGLAVVNALLIPTRNNFGFDIASDRFDFTGVEGLFLENDTFDPIDVTVKDQRSGAEFKLTVVGVLDSFASQGPYPAGFYTSSRTLEQHVSRTVTPTQFFFNVEPGVSDAAQRIEAAFFANGLASIDLNDEIEEAQAANKSFFNLLVAFMALGLVVGIAALGVISARAVVERRHEIGVLRSIGFSRRMVQAAFLSESSFIALVGIALGVTLGFLMSLNIVNDIRSDEANVSFVVPWWHIIITVVGAYLFSLLATFVPARQAGRIPPAEALRHDQ